MSPPKEFVPYLPGSKTGLCNPKCYAAELHDCSNEMSGEHYISHGVLRALSRDGITIPVGGFPWLKDDEIRSLPTQALESRILCKRHNRALADLDHVAKIFFMSIDRIDNAHAGGPPAEQDEVFFFNGHDIERWLLKTLCGIVFSRNAATRTNERIIGWKPNHHWLQILFGEERIPSTWGLYVEAEITHKAVINRGFACAPISNSLIGVHGASFVLNEKRLILAMTQPPTRKEDNILTGYVYRPNELRTISGGYMQVIRLVWTSFARGSSIAISYAP